MAGETNTSHLCMWLNLTVGRVHPSLRSGDVVPESTSW